MSTPPTVCVDNNLTASQPSITLATGVRVQGQRSQNLVKPVDLCTYLSPTCVQDISQLLHGHSLFTNVLPTQPNTQHYLTCTHHTHTHACMHACTHMHACMHTHSDTHHVDTHASTNTQYTCISYSNHTHTNHHPPLPSPLTDLWPTNHKLA